MSNTRPSDFNRIYDALRTLQFQFLADRPEAIPMVARWYFDQWGHKRPDNTFEKTLQFLQDTLDGDQFPLRVAAVEGQEVIGAATLKLREMDIFPDRKHWLGDVYVAPDSRGRGVASQLVQHMIERAASLDLQTLHLQTEQLDGGLYARLGWQPLEQVVYREECVLVMSRELAPAQR